MKSVVKFFLGAVAATMSFGLNAAELAKADVIAVLKKSADWHIANPHPATPTRAWEISPYYDGLIELSRVSGDPAYWAEVVRHGQGVGWTPYSRKYHADDHAVGHAWLETYRADTSKKERLNPFKKHFDSIIEDAKDPKYADKKGDNNPVNTWVWCDALFMAPPTLARLYAITGDQKFLDYMDKEYKWCYDRLWDKDDKLFYRDGNYIGKQNVNGKKIFWGRGNGWVFGGLTMILPELKKDNPSYAFYKQLFLEMAESIAKAQMPDGLWGVNLGDQNEKYAGGETSSSGFCLYGLAWGINNGYLEKAKYWPIVLKGWQGLTTRVLESGKVGYVQPVGAAPDAFSKEQTQSYGIGVFLLAGSEIARALDKTQPVGDAELVKQAEEMFRKNVKVAYTHIEPRRKDDIAWENDKMAFRAYGPALKEAVENSGIDLWFKLVDYPIIDKWYEQDFSGVRSYHELSAEGADFFKVGSSVGLGGTGIWKDGKLHKSNVYQTADVIWTTPDTLRICMRYFYDIDGEKYTESKIITLDYGASVCEVSSQFIKGNVATSYNGWRKKAESAKVEGLRVAAGLYPQTKDAKVETEDGLIVSTENFKGKTLQMYLCLDEKTKFIGFEKTQIGEVLALAETDSKGMIKYSFGFVWADKVDAANIPVSKKKSNPAAAEGLTEKPIAENIKDDGFRGIWYGIALRKSDDPGNYKYKYSGGLGTYPANHYPLAVYSKEVNKTFFVLGTVDKNGKDLVHEISYFDHASKKLAKPTILTNRKTPDAHDNPVMNIDAEGYLWVFSPTHGSGSRPSLIFKSKAPYDISAFEIVDAKKTLRGVESPLTNFSYPQVWRTKDGKWLMLFTSYAKPLLPKGSKTIRALYCTTSSDGVNWSEYVPYGAVEEGHYQSSGSYNGGEKIGTSFNYHPLGKKGGGLNSRTNLYFMQTLDGGKSWVNIDGQALSLPFLDKQNPALVRDYEKEGKLVYIHDLCYDAKGNPMILYITSKGFESGPENDPRTWTLARYNGKTWDYSDLASSDNNYDFGSIYVDGETIRVVGTTIPGPQKYNTGGEVTFCLSKDGGKTWVLEKQLTKDSKYNHSYPRRPINFREDFYAFWADGNGREKSESSFYFCDSKGNVFMMPREFTDAEKNSDLVSPIKIN